MVRIEDYKINPSKKIIDDIDIQVVYIPLESKLGYTYKEKIRAGEYVMIGSVLGTNPIAEIPLISTVSGTVVGFEDKYISSGKKVKCIAIENDFKDKYLNKMGKKTDITKYSKKEFIYLLKASSIIGMSGNAYPTYIKYENNEPNYLIVNGCECEIGASADNAIMYNKTEEILEAIDAIIEIMNLKKAYIAINEKNDIIKKELLKHINSYQNIKIYPIIDGYPNGYEKFLVSEILDLKYQRDPEEVGVVCENVSTIFAIYEALKYHKPLTERIVTISGKGIKTPANYKLKIGTNFNEINLKTNFLKELKNPILISGGLMMGISIPSNDFIITGDTNSLVYTEEEENNQKECLKCGKCTEVCPVNLIPSLIITYPERQEELRIDKCIECGLCSYICPAKIEIREKIKNIKGDK